MMVMVIVIDFMNNITELYMSFSQVHFLVIEPLNVYERREEEKVPWKKKLFGYNSQVGYPGSNLFSH